MKTRFEPLTRLAPALAFALVLAVSHACILPQSAEAQQAETATLEDGRFEATFTTSDGDVHRFSGVAWVNTANRLWLCPDGSPFQPSLQRQRISMPVRQDLAEGEYRLFGRPSWPLRVTNLPTPIQRDRALQPGSSMTITVASEQLLAGSIQAHYADGILAAGFRARVGAAPAGFGDQCEPPRGRADPWP